MFSVVQGRLATPKEATASVEMGSQGRSSRSGAEAEADDRHVMAKYFSHIVYYGRTKNKLLVC